MDEAIKIRLVSETSKEDFEKALEQAISEGYETPFNMVVTHTPNPDSLFPNTTYSILLTRKETCQNEG